MKFDVISVGSAVIDVFLETDFNDVGEKICFPTGTKLLVKHLSMATGGGGTNSAVSFSRFGFKTGFLGELGKDENARIILDELKKEKVKFLGKFGEGMTGYSVVIDGKKKNRTILTYKGANDNYSFNELILSELKTKWFYFSAMIGKSLLMQERLALWAKKKGIKIAYNPSSYLTRTREKAMTNLLRKVDILILNDEEARDLVKKGDLFYGLRELGPKIVCITYGDKGNKVLYESNVYVSKPHKIKVTERTGAGDAFASGFVAGLTKTRDIHKAMKIGTLNAESVIQNRGAKVGLLRWNEVMKKVKGDGVEISKR